MQRHVTLRLFRQGTAAEVTLTFLLLVAVALLFTDALWKSSNPIRQTIATVVYPFQRLVMLPKDALTAFDGWLNAASLIKTESEALQRQRIELAQVATRAALLTAENEQLRRLLGVLEKRQIARQSWLRCYTSHRAPLCVALCSTKAVAPGSRQACQSLMKAESWVRSRVSLP